MQPSLATARFWSKVAKVEGDGCWEWIGARHRNGYGKTTLLGGGGYAHRVAWILAHGPIPMGRHFFVCHHCDNRPCVRPDHLFLGSPMDNKQDSVRKGRHRVPPPTRMAGLANPRGNATLTPEIVSYIRAASAAGRSGASMAREFGVGPTAIDNVIHRYTWKHVP